MKSLRFFSLLLVCFFLQISTAHSQMGRIDDWEEWEDEHLERIEVRDPYESFNRKMFAFNDKVYKYVLEPLSKGYDFLLPKKVQKSFHNLFTNVRMPIRFFNSILQGKFKGASTSMGRFLINSSIGLGGLFDPADQYFHLELQDEDFGQTLGFHGMDAGPYIVFPLLGPSTRRDSIGLIGDAALDPMTWLFIFEVRPEAAVYGARGLWRTNQYSYKVRDNYNDIITGAIDPYIAIQDAYIQTRQKRIEE